MAEKLFSEKFISHLSSELGKDSEDVVNALTSFFNKTEKTSAQQKLKVSPKKDEKPKTVNKKPQKEEEHFCERVPTRGAKGACGKKAKNSIPDEEGVIHWYCGTENSGCLKSILGAQKRKNKTNASDISVNQDKKPGGLSSNKTASDAKSKSLANGAAGSRDFEARKITVDGKILWIDHKSRVLFDRTTEEAYGILDKDNKTILDLSKDVIRQLEASGRTIAQKKPTETKKSLEKKIKNISIKKEEEDDLISEIKSETNPESENESEIPDCEDDIESEQPESELELEDSEEEISDEDDDNFALSEEE